MTILLYSGIPVPNSLPNDVFPIVLCVIVAVAVLAFYAGKER